MAKTLALALSGAGVDRGALDCVMVAAHGLYDSLCDIAEDMTEASPESADDAVRILCRHAATVHDALIDENAIPVDDRERIANDLTGLAEAFQGMAKRLLDTPEIRSRIVAAMRQDHLFKRPPRSPRRR